MISSFRLITRDGVSLGLSMFVAVSCSTTSEDAKDPYNDILHGTIAYPFASPAEPLGITAPEDRFIIRSAVGNREYAIEIPGGGRDFDVEVPLAQIESGDEAFGMRPGQLPSPAATDRELIASLPNIATSHQSDTSLLDSAFGVADKDGPAQSPSYAIGLAKVNQHYKARRFEYALIEINDLLAFYPTSPKLLKMKGTVLLKMHNYVLAEKSWSKALELAPGDISLQKGLELLRRKTATGH